MFFCCMLAMAMAQLTPLPEKGPLYEMLETYHAANPQTPQEQAQWAKQIADALTAYPDEEWSTRVRAYEDAGSIFWHMGDYEQAAPIFLEQWREADARQDSGEAVRSLDNLMNLYSEAKMPEQETLDLYDATEDWLRRPPPGKEQDYAQLLQELHGERAKVLRNFAQEKENNSAAQQEDLRQADYFDGLAAGTAEATHTPHGTLQDIARAWMAKSGGAPPVTPPGEGVAVAQSPTRAPLSPASAKTAPTTTPPLLPALPPLAKEPIAPAAPAAGLPSEFVVFGGAAVILGGWGIAAYVYLRRTRR